MTSNTPSAELVSHVKSLVGDEDLSSEQVNRVIVAYQAVYAGAELGTVMMNPKTGAIAKRVDVDGVHKWQVLDDGGMSFDTRPTLDGWELVPRPVVE
ncbi:hypothetical protein [Mycolicibacterium austroafricanum]|uniref:hypothetical protein n=1 Tax=Mycolicibacterium austroafricanum TaxID=39687 RepID=UPI001CA30C70|nr:hypothetical protein [Mycolicibacterium austroafricanum]QZT61234.1 hypothetical protein JN085_19905 [Mycolicibacterium austroafricanum]